MIYNKEIKQRYIDYKVKNTSIPEVQFLFIFRKTEPLERLLNKDLYQFSPSEIEDLFKLIDFESLNSLNVANSILSGYVDWCIIQGLTTNTENYFTNLSVHDLGNFINKAKKDDSIVSRDEVLGWCQKLENYCDRFALLGVFEGLDGKNHNELTRMKVGDINKEKNEITLERGVRKFSSTLCNYAIESNNQREHYSMSKNRVKVVYLKDSDYIIKEYPNSNCMGDDIKRGQRIYVSLKKVFNYLDVNYMSINKLKMSGIIHLVNSEAKRRGISGEQFVFDHKDIVQYQYDFIYRPIYFVKEYGDYLI